MPLTESLLLRIPHDVLLLICSKYAQVTDVLSLQQTCRALHVFGESSYLWHRIVLGWNDVPLDIPRGQNILSLSGPDLQRIVIRALRLDNNWCKQESRIRNLAQAPLGDLIFNIHILENSQWLLVLSRNVSGMTSLSLCCLNDLPEVSRTAVVDIPNATRCIASTLQGSPDVIVAVLGSSNTEKLLRIYRLSLDLSDSRPVPALIGSSIRDKSGGQLYYEVRACGYLVAATLLQFGSVFIAPRYQIVFVNTLTGEEVILEPDYSEPINNLSFRLFPKHVVVITDVGRSSLSIRMYQLPSSLSDAASFPYTPSTSPGANFGKPVAELRPTVVVTGLYDHHISERSYHLLNTDTACLSMVSFPSYRDDVRGPAYLYRFLFDFSARSPSIRLLPPSGECLRSNNKLQLPPEASAGLVCVGATGHRAVWLETRWDSDDCRLMKMSLSLNPSMKPSVGLSAVPLVPSHVPLPFPLRACTSMTLDEVTGRLCLALHTGNLYVLDL